MNKKKQELEDEIDTGEENARAELGVKPVLGHHREEFSEDRKPQPYHFASDQLQHKEDPITSESKTT